MFPQTLTNNLPIQELPEEGSSYICYTYIDLEENVRKQFNLDKALEFFFLDEKALSHYQIPKGGSHLFYMMMFQCIVCSDENFDMRNDERTKKVKDHWQQNSGIPSEISRYVIKLNISEISAQKLYKEEKFAILGKHIIGKREDKITEKNPFWVLGDLQIVEIKPGTETKLEEGPRCSIV